jgi:predicted dehydrogenase
VARIGVGIVGIGVAALSGHIPALIGSDEFDLLAICDRDRGRLEDAQKRWCVPYAYTDIEEFHKTPGLAAVIIATPPDSHFEIANAALARGKHVLVEKPMATNLQECRVMVEMAAQNRLCLVVGYEKRFHPTFEKVRCLVEEGLIGSPYYCGVHWSSNVKLDPLRLVPEGFGPGYEWRWKDPAIGGGIVQDHLPHYVDLMRYWIDKIPVAVYAEIMNVARDLLDWPAEDSVWEDLGLIVVRFSNGFILRFETGTVGRSLSPLWAQGSGVGEWTEYGYLLGTEGQLLFDLLPWDSSENGRIAIWRVKWAAAQGTGWSYFEQKEPSRCRGSPAGAAHAMFTAQLREFARAIAGAPSRAATGEDGAMGIAAVESAYRSAKTRQECSIVQQVTPLTQPHQAALDLENIK